MSVNEWKVQNYQKVLDFKVHFFFVFGFLYRSINHLSSCPAENIWDILWLQRIFISAVVFRSAEATKDIYMEIKLFGFRFITETGSPLIYFTILVNHDSGIYSTFCIFAPIFMDDHLWVTTERRSWIQAGRRFLHRVVGCSVGWAEELSHPVGASSPQWAEPAEASLPNTSWILPLGGMCLNDQIVKTFSSNRWFLKDVSIYWNVLFEILCKIFRIIKQLLSQIISQQLQMILWSVVLSGFCSQFMNSSTLL